MSDEPKNYATGGPLFGPLEDGSTWAFLSNNEPIIYAHFTSPDGSAITYRVCNPKPIERPDWGARFRLLELERAHAEALLENACREYDKTLAWVKAISAAARGALDRLDFATKHFAFRPAPVKPARDEDPS